MPVHARSAWGLFVLRVVVGVIFIMHGIPKLTGGVGETAQFFATLDLPAPLLLAWLVTLLETFGGIALVLGVLTPIWNVLFIIHMATGIALVHGEQGFYVIGPGSGGYEFNLLLIAANFCLLLAGPGALALLSRRRAGARL